jgi:putative copper resistance protein D
MGRRPVGRVRAASAIVALSVAVVVPAPVRAHGTAPGAPEISTLWTGWSFDVEVWLPIVAAGWLYLRAVRSIDRAHPANPVPRRRIVAWFAGLAMLLVALQSPIDRYDTTLFSVHMVQHLLLTLVVPPLLLLGAPMTQAMRAAPVGVRRGLLLPVLHSRVLLLLASPLVAWILFGAFGYAAHFSPLFDAALDDPLLHYLEHVVFLVSGLLFWWPVVALDPTPRRLFPVTRVGYVALGMPWSSFLGLAIFSASTVLYPHYASIQRTWGISPLEDQALAGGLMWAVGDLVFIGAIVLAVRVWLRAEESEGRRIDQQLAARTRPHAQPDP